jgi:hypothetical protein
MAIPKGSSVEVPKAGITGRTQAPGQVGTDDVLRYLVAYIDSEGIAQERWFVEDQVKPVAKKGS